MCVALYTMEKGKKEAIEKAGGSMAALAVGSRDSERPWQRVAEQRKKVGGAGRSPSKERRVESVGSESSIAPVKAVGLELRPAWR